MCRFMEKTGVETARGFTTFGQIRVSTVLAVSVATFTGLQWAATSPTAATRQPMRSGLFVVVPAVCLCLCAKELLRRLDMGGRRLKPKSAARQFPAEALQSADKKFHRLQSEVCRQGSNHQLRRSQSGESTASDAPGYAAPAMANSGNSFPVGRPDVPHLNVPQEQMSWFEQEVMRTYAVVDRMQGTGCGEIIKHLKAPLPGHLGPLFKQLHSSVEPAGPQHWQLHEPIDDVFFSRILIATDFDARKATALAKRYIEFRHKQGGGVVPPPAWQDSGLVLVPFVDRRGRPVVLLRPRFHDPKTQSPSLLEAGMRGTLDSIIAYFLLQRNGQISELNPLEQYVLVIDAEGCGFRNFSMNSIKVMVREGASRYPDRLATMAIIGVNSSVSAMFGMASSIIHPRTKKKVILKRHSEVHGFMRELISPELLPPEYGGTAPSLPSTSECCDLSGSVGAIVASVWELLGIDPQGGVSLIRVSSSSEREQATAGRPVGNDRGFPFFLRIQEPGGSVAPAAQQREGRQCSVAECAELIHRLRGIAAPTERELSSSWHDCLPIVCGGAPQSQRWQLPREARTASGLELLLNRLASSPEGKEVVRLFLQSGRHGAPPEWWPPGT